MTRASEGAQLTFVSIHPNNLISLSDGTIWKVPPEAARLARMWRKGDPVAVKGDIGNYDWAFRIVSLGSSASLPATPSARPVTG